MSSWGYRVCAACGQDLEDTEYSSNQWRKGVGYSRCRVCVMENFNSYDCNGTMRTNNAGRASFDFDNIIGEGAFRYVCMGRYTGGLRTGQLCVAKWFKDGFIDAESFIESDLEAVDLAGRLISQWNNAGFIGDVIRLNSPDRWNGGPQGVMLVEPYIEDFQKFNSNTGWYNRSSRAWIQIMQALSHYTYHISSGMYLLCDLQGGLYRDGAILTDPVIHSRRQEYGATDLGPEGISTFFHHHRCNQYCHTNWTVPRDKTAYYRTYKGTTFDTGR